MRVLLDTNIIIHREANNVINKDIGTLLGWLDKLHYTKCVHPTTIDEIRKFQNEKIVTSMLRKLDNYTVLKTIAPLGGQVQAVSQKIDVNENDKGDTQILNEVFEGRVAFLITEDKKIHTKAGLLGISDKVFKIESFLEKIVAENPSLTDYKVLSIKKELFGNIDIYDSFFDSLKEDYIGFEKWFNKKADETAYICFSETQKLLAFLYIKVEKDDEPYSINPLFLPKKRLKIGTFKVILNGYKLGERFLKVIFDNALKQQVDEIYVTIFDKRDEQRRLIMLLEEWGFIFWGKKGEAELVYVRDFSRTVNKMNLKSTYPFITKSTNFWIVPVYPEYHTELFPDSILRTESPLNFVENEPHRNAICKVYVSRSLRRDLQPGDIIVFYRTKEPGTHAVHSSVVTTIAIVESVVTNISDASHFISLCRKRSVYTDQELANHWNYNPKYRPFIVNFLYTYSLNKRINLQNLLALQIISDISKVPRGFEPLTRQHFETIIQHSQSDASFIIN